ncbi:hypothetical protein MASR2M8_13920 [Opitutaceae bacterium]
MALFFPPAIQAAQQVGTAAEYQVKAVFIFNCVQFFEWPPASFSGTEDP